MEQLEFLKLQMERYEADFLKRFVAELNKTFKKIRGNKTNHAKIYKKLKI